MALTKEREVDLAAPARPTKEARAGRVKLEDAVLDEQGPVVRCPNDIAPVSDRRLEQKNQETTGLQQA